MGRIEGHNREGRGALTWSTYIRIYIASQLLFSLRLLQH